MAASSLPQRFFNAIGAVLTGFSAAAGTVAATDTILQAINKIVGNFTALRTEGTTASSSTPTPTGDARENIYDITALAANATFGAPSGTAANHNTLLIRIKDNATARTLAWNTIYRASTDFALPTTTVISKTMYVQFIYNGADTKWDLIGLTNGF